MQIKRLFLLLISIFVFIVSISAQKLTVEKMESLTMDTYASTHKRVDLNGNACAVVRVSLTVSGATFSGNVVGNVTRDGSDYLVYMPAGSKKLWVKHPNYHELEVNFGDYGIAKLQSLVTYRVTVNAPQTSAQQKKQTLNIKVTPGDAMVLIDDEMVEGTSVMLSVGTHKYNVAAKGYDSQSGTIDVPENRAAKLIIELDRKQSATFNSPSPSVVSQPVQQPASAPVQTANAEDLYKKGDEYYNNKNYTEAVKLYRQAADMGYAKAQGDLGYCYQKGQGVSQDYSQAVYWYRKAADQGDATAQCDLGYCYSIGQGVSLDYSQAVYWYRKAADQGDATAQSNLGYCYDKGLGITQDYSQAVYWYRKAADQGYAMAQSNLGVCYEKGQGVTQDYSQAVYWYRKAADQGYAIAQYNLAQRYYYGNGVAIDKKQAKVWYEKAAAQGYEDAKNKLQSLTF